MEKEKTFEEIKRERMMLTLRRMCYWLCAIGSLWVSPAVALFMGIALALTIGAPYAKSNKKVSKYLLQAAVVGLGFGMNLHSSLAAGREGMMFTIVSVVGVMIVGVVLGRVLRVNPKNAYLISSGTAICGGSAIAAVAPIIDADDNDTSLALATIFILNAVALFIFPPIGEALGLTQQQFGTWAAIAIHDTSSVVGAGAAYGEEALRVATTIKLTRALWIFPLAFVSVLIFRSRGKRVAVPWFILFFVVAMIANTYLPIPEGLTSGIVVVAKKALSVTLFLIGCGLSLGAIRKVGARPLILGVVLWATISVVSLLVVL
ncbi:MAG: putative sulfate exporter family transporter [Tidjanibacter sp.]|nr:putative sulfate exporter family transporter [Tidjanibacter sp.]MBQ2247221.1 putative sulfate exporter family transporter [Tidjanibacter sp.]